MIEIERMVLPSAYQWYEAIMGMRNPMNSWDKSDSKLRVVDNSESIIEIGENDLALMLKLSKAGSVHCKYLRMLPVTVTLNAPLYFWKEFDTYKVGTVSNSCSTMHKLLYKPFEMCDFSFDKLLVYKSGEDVAKSLLMLLNQLRDLWYKCENDLRKKEIWYCIIQLLPESYNQKRTIMLNYEVLKHMYYDRKNHKLDEWRRLCEWMESLPYSELITEV